MERLLAAILNRVVRHGQLTVVMASGARHVFGDGSGPPLGLRFTDREAQWAFLLDPYLKMGELFMDGRLVVEEGDVFGVLDLLLGELKGKTEPAPARLLHTLRFALRRFAQRNGLTRSRRNVAHHYDLDGRLYDLFLDRDRQYSCAYYEREDLTLDEAQAAKRRHIAAKLALRGGERVLDTGLSGVPPPGRGGVPAAARPPAGGGSAHARLHRDGRGCARTEGARRRPRGRRRVSRAQPSV